MQSNKMDLMYFVTNFDILAVFPEAKIIKYAETRSFREQKTSIALL